MSRTFDSSEIVTLAARVCQVIGPNVTGLDQQRLAIGLQFLDMVVAEVVGTDSLFWEATGPREITLVADQPSYNIATLLSSDAPQFVHRAFVRDSSGYDSPLTFLSREQYDDLSDKDASGVPDRIYIEHGKSLAYPYPVVAASGYSVFLDSYGFSRDLTKSTGSIPHDLPNSWQMNLVYRLAAVIGDGPLIKAPQGDRERWDKKIRETGDVLAGYANRRNRPTGFVRPYMP